MREFYASPLDADGLAELAECVPGDDFGLQEGLLAAAAAGRPVCWGELVGGEGEAGQVMFGGAIYWEGLSQVAPGRFELALGS